MFYKKFQNKVLHENNIDLNVSCVVIQNVKHLVPPNYCNQLQHKTLKINDTRTSQTLLGT